MPRIRSGVSSTRMAFLVSARSAPSVKRPISSARSNRARKSSASSGRGAPGAVRRPSVIPKVVPGWISSSGTAPPTNWATLAVSSRPTPARRSMRSRLSPRASVVTSSSVGRSGAAASGAASVVAPMRRPLSAPSASGRIIWLRYSSRTASSTWTDGAASSGAKLGQKASATAVSPTNVPTPRTQRRLPISLPRSGARSSPASRTDRRSRTVVHEVAARGSSARIWSCASAAAWGPCAEDAGKACPSSVSAGDLYTCCVPSVRRSGATARARPDWCASARFAWQNKVKAALTCGHASRACDEPSTAPAGWLRAAARTAT